MEKKRFIKCNLIAYTAPDNLYGTKVVQTETVASFFDRSIVKTLVRYPTRNANLRFEAPGGWYHVNGNVQFRVENEADVKALLAETMEETASSNSVADAILHLTRELSYNPGNGRVGPGSEYLQAADRQRETFGLPPSFIPPPPQHKGK